MTVSETKQVSLAPPSGGEGGDHHPHFRLAEGFDHWESVKDHFSDQESTQTLIFPNSRTTWRTFSQLLNNALSTGKEAMVRPAFKEHPRAWTDFKEMSILRY